MDLSKLGRKDQENIIKEIQSHSKMDHPNIIRMIDFMKTGNMIFILLEYVEKGNLFYYLTGKQKLPETEIAKIFYQTCLAIDHVHKKGFIHRDLKPENILLDKHKNVKLCDFGWCTSLDDTEYRQGITNLMQLEVPGQLFRQVIGGTYEYMAPESIKNCLQGVEVDMWALGVLLYELFHNKEPFRGKSTKEVLKSILGTDLRFAFGISKEAIDLIKKLLVIDPHKRIKMDSVLEHPFFVTNQVHLREHSTGGQKLANTESRRCENSHLMRSVSLNVLDDKFDNRYSAQPELHIKRNQVTVPEIDERENQCYAYSSAITSSSPKFYKENCFTNIYSIKPHDGLNLKKETVLEQVSNQMMEDSRRVGDKKSMLEVVDRSEKLRAGSVDSRLKIQTLRTLRFHPENAIPTGSQQKNNLQLSASVIDDKSRAQSIGTPVNKLQLSFNMAKNDSVQKISLSKPFLRNASQVMSPVRNNLTFQPENQAQSSFINDISNKPVLQLNKNIENRFDNHNVTSESIRKSLNKQNDASVLDGSRRMSKDSAVVKLAGFRSQSFYKTIDQLPSRQEKPNPSLTTKENDQRRLSFLKKLSYFGAENQMPNSQSIVSTYLRQNFENQNPSAKHQYKKSNTLTGSGTVAGGNFISMTPTNSSNQDPSSNFNLRLFGGRKDSENHPPSGFQFTAYRAPAENHLSQKYYKTDQLTASRYSYTTNIGHHKYPGSLKTDLFARPNNKSNNNLVTLTRDGSIPRFPQQPQLC